MTESNESKTNFTGTYFDRDLVIRLASWARTAAWIVLTVYVFNWLFNFSNFLIQFSAGMFFQKGMNPIDIINFFTPYLLMPLPGFVYFIGLQAVGSALLILLDMEDNLRRAARK